MRPTGAAKRNVDAPKPSAIASDGVRAGVEQQVTAGDADVERALPHVDRDVAGTQVEELDVVVGVDGDEVLGGAALAVAGLRQHLGGGLGEGALVGHGNGEHGLSFRRK